MSLRKRNYIEDLYNGVCVRDIELIKSLPRVIVPEWLQGLETEPVVAPDIRNVPKPFELRSINGQPSPNEAEQELLEFLEYSFPGQWKYTGNDDNINIGNKNPDFIHTSERVVIELFSDYYHKEPYAEEERVKHFEQYGYKCKVVWYNNVNSILEQWEEIENWIVEALK